MTRSRLLASTLLLGALAIGCTINNASNETEASTSTSTTSATNPSGSQSGSVTSAPGSATDGTVSDSTPTMATATTTSGTSDGTSSTGEPCSFLNCDDMMSDFNECDQWAQDCPEGQKCTAYIAEGTGTWDATKCVEVTGADKPDDKCTSKGFVSGIDSCIKGAMCWGLDMDGVGTCVALCSGSPDAPLCEYGFCTIASGGALSLCLANCDPLLQDCHHPGEVCYPVAEGFSCAPDDLGEEGQANDPCEFINSCDKGLMCADAAFVGAGCMPGVTGCCTPFCKFPDGPCPNPDQQCVQYFDPAQLPDNDPWLDIGVCGVPG
jgi:hypothetical protein